MSFNTPSSPNPLRCAIAYNKYGGYCVPYSSHHRQAAQKILAKDVYEPDTIEFLMSNCGEGDIVHAGTYFGDFLPAISSATSPDAIIWAFEPNNENYRCARITMEINQIDNVQLANAGLGEHAGTSMLEYRDAEGNYRGGASTIISTPSGGQSETEEISIMTLDETIDASRHVSIIQLDVEGHEQQALAGAMNTIKRCTPILILETLTGSTLMSSDWFIDNILDMGYRKTQDLHDNSVLMIDTQ